MNDQPALYNMGSITQKQSLYQVKIGYFKCLDDYTGPLTRGLLLDIYYGLIIGVISPSLMDH